MQKISVASNAESIDFAFIIKNYLPIEPKILLFHNVFGIISVRIKNLQVGHCLSTGMFVEVVIYKNYNQYWLTCVDLIASTPSHQILKIHDIFTIMMRSLSHNIPAPELFDFCRFLYSNIDDFDDAAWAIIILRIFCMCDVLVPDQMLVKIAFSDPMQAKLIEQNILDRYLQSSWALFYQKKVDSKRFIR